MSDHPEFRHTPEAPMVYDSHPTQRYFLESQYSLLRMSHSQHATLVLKVISFDHEHRSTGRAELRKHLSAAELLTLARACIDAAHDLQANPPHVLEAA